MSTVKPAEIGSPLPLAKIVIEPLGDNSTYAPFLEADSTHREWVKFSKWYNESVP
ncbi:MAG: hypothetical protein R3D89_06720 [Sphingomonadaceae bacterium]